jgi:glutaredoxin
MAKDELTLRGVPFDYVDLEEINKTASEVTGRRVGTVPQIYFEGNYIGGYDDLMAKLNKPIDGGENDECLACQG